MKLAAVLFAGATVAAVIAYFAFFYISSTDAAALYALNLDGLPPGNYECAISRISFENSLVGTMYVLDRQARLDFPDARLHGIAIAGTVYVWKDNDTIGVELLASTAFAEPEQSLGVSKTVKCRRVLSVDPTLFVLPAYVDFKNSAANSDT